MLELTTAWAGPMAGRILAHLGAEVIKVESLARIDAWRGGLRGDRRRYPNGEPGQHPYNRSAWFNTQNHDKRSIELDLRSASGQETMGALVAASDVLICNLAPGALDRLGLGCEALTRLQRTLVTLQISSFGPGGEYSDHVGVGPTIEATTGAMTLIGYGDAEPQNTGSAYIDPIGGMSGAAMVLTALLAHKPDGQGARIELSLRETAMQWLGEYLIRQDRTGACPQPLGNDRPGGIPTRRIPNGGG